MASYANARWFHTMVSLFACSLGLSVVIFPEVHANTTDTSPKINSKLLLISFDGFRWDYLDLVKRVGRDTPNFDYLIKRGVISKGVRPTFTTSTLPNHYSMATGMYQESHGIVSKEMFDPLFNESFSRTDIESTTKSFWWNNGTEENGAEPMWITNQKDEGKDEVEDDGLTITKLKSSKSKKKSKTEKWSGVLFWVGSNMNIRGHRPHYFMNYDHHFPFKLRIDLMLMWFLGKVTPINLGMMYFSEPDELGHDVGPESPLMIDKIVELDELVGYLIEQLKEKDLFEQMNIIITSDHGLAQLKGSINVDDYVNPNLFSVYGGQTVWNILPNQGQEDYVYDALKKVPNLAVYRKKKIPEEYHYRYNRRILPILAVASEGYTLCTAGRNCSETGGAHGYNNSLESMHTIFLAHGPAFRRGYEADRFDIVDIYPLVCKILDIKPAPNNGSLANVRQMLRRSPRPLVQLAMQHVTASNLSEYHHPVPTVKINNLYVIVNLVQAFLLVVSCGIAVALIDMP